MKANLVPTVFCSALLAVLSAPPLWAAEGGYHDPSDVTALVTSISPVLEYQAHENGDDPDDELWEFKLEGQYSRGSVLLLADLGYGTRTGTDKSGITDSRIRFFHVPVRNEDPDAFISALGWSIDAFLPFGNVDDGLGSGNYTFAPGVIWSHDFRGWSLSPNLVYQLTWANDDLADLLGEDDPRHSQAVRLELSFAIDTPERYWFQVTPSFTHGVKNTDDGAFVKAFTGFHINQQMSLGVELQWNFEVRQGRLQEVPAGEKYKARLHWEIYF